MWLGVWLAALLWAIASYDDGDSPYTVDEWRQYVASSPPAPPRHPSNATSDDFVVASGDGDISNGDAKWFDETQGHFDHRWYRYTPKYHTSQNTLWRLATAWLEYADQHKLDTWLAHGTLLGWYWNRLPLPWDNDLDVQITATSFEKLEAANGTFFEWRHHQYYLDVNPHWRWRQGTKNNTIDARFIDTSTGMYVDITVLSLANDVPAIDFGESAEFDLVVDPQLRDKSATMIKGDVWRQRRDQLRGQLVHCKDNHYYAIEDILPLVPTQLCGAVAWVPQRYRQILEREYPRGVRDTVYGGHTFHRQLRLWVKSRLCGSPGKCHNREILQVAEVAKNYTSLPLP